MNTTTISPPDDWTGTPARHAAALVLALAGTFALASSWSDSRATPVDPATAPSGARAVSTIDLNSATQEELESLPGIGPALAARIMVYRKTHGDFSRIDDLDKVRGIGPVTLENIRRHVSVR